VVSGANSSRERSHPDRVVGFLIRRMTLAKARRTGFKSRCGGADSGVTIRP
jgi:hypothetical protein